MGDRRERLAELLERTAEAVRAAPVGNSPEWREACRMAQDSSMFAHQVGEVEIYDRRDGPLPDDFQMARLGWSVGIEVGSMGRKSPGCTVRVERWSWHGDFTDRVSFMASCGSVEDIPETRDRAVRIALRAWRQFTEPGCPPQQGPHGSLSRDKFREGIRAHVIAGREPSEAGKVMRELHARIMDGLPLFDEPKAD